MGLYTSQKDGETQINIKNIIISVVSVIVIGVLFFSSVHSVQAGRVGVVTQFGKVTGRQLSAGLNFTAPWPIQDVWIANIQVQRETVDVNGAASAGSKDLQQVDTVVVLNYHINDVDAGKIYKNLSPDYKNRVIDPAIQEVMKATISNYNASELLVKRPEVKAAADTAITARLGKYGIIVDDLSIVNFNFSNEFNKAIEQKQVAEQMAQQAQYALDKAKLDAQAQEAQKATLSDQLLQKLAIDKWDGKMPQYVGSGSVFNIPLTK